MHSSRFVLTVLAATVVGGCMSILGADFDDLKSKGSSSSTTESPTDDPDAASSSSSSSSGSASQESPGAPPPPTKPSNTGECPAPTTKKCGELCVSPADQQFGCNCKPMSRFYEDKDGDGFGSDRVIFACAIGPGLSDKSGDCNDGNKDVFPDQPKYFGQPYTSPITGKKSFDYDCSDKEEPDHSVGLDGDQPICSPSIECNEIFTMWCWKPADPPRSGGFDKCGAQLWKCFNLASGWEKVESPEQMKAYPCH